MSSSHVTDVRDAWSSFPKTPVPHPQKLGTLPPPKPPTHHLPRIRWQRTKLFGCGTGAQPGIRHAPRPRPAPQAIDYDRDLGYDYFGSSARSATRFGARSGIHQRSGRCRSRCSIVRLEAVVDPPVILGGVHRKFFNVRPHVTP